MSETKTRMGAAGRVVIPAEVRRAMQVSEGDELIVVLEEDGVRLLTAAQAARRAQKLVARYVSPKRRLSEELIADRREEAARD